MKKLRLPFMVLILLVCSYAHAQIDSTFGVNGSVRIHFYGRQDSLTRIKLQTDGKILMTGFVSRGFDTLTGMDSTLTALVRLRPDGSPDPTFGVNGKVTTAIGVRSQPNDLVIQPDGKIIVAGLIDSLTAPYTHEAALLRYLPDGVLDSTFGINGMVITSSFQGDTVRSFTSVALDQSGRILVSTEQWFTIFVQPVYRYNTDGSPDVTFVTPRYSWRNTDKVTVQPDGKILILQTLLTNNNHSILMRLDSMGAIDNTYGIGGTVDLQVGAIDFARQNNGAEVLCSGITTSLRVNAGGSLDNTFGVGGSGSTYFSGAEGASVALQADSKVLVSGTIYSNPDVKALIVRYTASGVIDSAFAGDGGYIIGKNDTTQTRGASLCLQHDQKILVGATIYANSFYPGEFLVMRLNPALQPDSMVWPGDADADHIADNVDLLPIGLAYDSMGPLRAVQGIVWQGDAATDWTDSFTTYAPNVNFKHADCNGDGTVDANDTLAIMQNFGFVHAKTGGYGRPWRSGIPGITIHYSKDTVIAGDTLTVSLLLGDSATLVSSIYGIAFTYHYDALVVDTTSVAFTFINSFLGISPNNISIHKDFRADGTVKAAVTGIDHINRSGYGQIAEFVCIITTDNINGKNLLYYPNVNYVSDIIAIDRNGNRITLNEGVDSNQVGYEPTGMRETSTVARISIYPNPASGKVTVRVDESITGITITDIWGQEALSSAASFKKTALVDVSALASGVYTIHVSTTVGSGTAKLIVTR